MEFSNYVVIWRAVTSCDGIYISKRKENWRYPSGYGVRWLRTTGIPKHIRLLHDNARSDVSHPVREKLQGIRSGRFGAPTVQPRLHTLWFPLILDLRIYLKSWTLVTNWNKPSKGDYSYSQRSSTRPGFKKNFIVGTDASTMYGNYMKKK